MANQLKGGEEELIWGLVEEEEVEVGEGWRGGGHKEEGREGEKEVMEEECRGGVICGYGCCPFCRSVRVLIL